MLTDVPPNRVQNNFISKATKVWSVAVKFVTAFLSVNSCYLAYYSTSLLSSVLGLVTMKNKMLDIWVYLTRSLIFTAIHATVLTRRKLYRDATSRLIDGRLNPYEDRPLLKKRVYASLSALLISFVFIVTLNLVEAAVVSIRHPDLASLLVDRVSFGSSKLIGERNCLYILIVDNLFYIAINSANALLLILCGLFVLTLVNRVKSYSGLIREIPVLTVEVLKELHDEFQFLQSDIKNVDDMFSVLFFLWYFDALVSAFNGFQYFLNNELGFFGPIYVALNFFPSPAVILIETYVASTIPLELEIAKSALTETARRSNFDHLPLELYLLSNSMNDNQMGLTVAGFFPITRSVCLSFVGFLITYLIVLISSRNSNS